MSGERHDPWRVRSALLTVQLLFGFHYLVAKWIVAEMSPAAWACLRVVSAFVIIGSLNLLLRRGLPGLRTCLYLGVCAFFGVVLNQALFLEGIARNTASNAALMCSLIPTFALLFSILARQERASRRKLLSFAAGLAGVLVLLEADRFSLSGEYTVGNLLNLANAASYGLYIVLARQVLKREDPLRATTALFLFSAIGMIAYGGDDLLRADFSALSSRVIWGMVFAVIGATVLTYFLNLWALGRAQASRVALYIFLQPVIASLLGVLLLRETLGPRLLIALGLVFLALLLRDGGPRRERRT